MHYAPCTMHYGHAIFNQQKTKGEKLHKSFGGFGFSLYF